MTSRELRLGTMKSGKDFENSNADMESEEPAMARYGSRDQSLRARMAKKREKRHRLENRDKAERRPRDRRCEWLRPGTVGRTLALIRQLDVSKGGGQDSLFLLPPRVIQKLYELKQWSPKHIAKSDHGRYYRRYRPIRERERIVTGHKRFYLKVYRSVENERGRPGV
ncbi:hypothetical protein V1478_016049 [Vespula squamosa]|uniref:Uncharacterized protein n=1 Tax=Vespula squamosa TaxID=30214 RepID=A0ABD2A2M4_VESSQ